jgi:NIPSNAP
MSCCIFSQAFRGRTGFLVGVLVLALCVGITASQSVSPTRVKGDNKVDTRVYELRTYYAAPGKMEALHARFRDYTVKIFEKHGLKVEGFWKPLDEKAQSEKLVYLLSFPSKEAADQAWKDFREDPDWIKARDDSEKDGKLLIKPPESVYLISTDYAPVK